MDSKTQKRIIRAIITAFILAGYGVSIYMWIVTGTQVSIYLWGAIFFLLGYYFHDDGFTFTTPAFEISTEEEDNTD